MEKAMPAVRAPFNQSAGSSQDVKERFYRHFQEEVTDLQQRIGQLGNLSLVGGERQDATDYCLASITRLSNEVVDATDYLPAYDQRTYSQAIKGLSENLQEVKAKAAPRTRFRFTSTSKNSSAVSINDAAQLAKESLDAAMKSSIMTSTESSIATTPADSMTPLNENSARDIVGDLPSFPKNYNDEMATASDQIRKPSFSEASTINITGHTGLHIILPSSASRATSSGAITKLNRCIVDMSVPTANGAPFAGLALKNIKHSLVIAGHVAGPAHITSVEDSIIVVTSRQVRMHECKNVDIYLHCASRPIIEDCSNVRFAPIPDPQNVTDESIENQWDQVDDFKWLKAEPSPNWTILPEEERLKEEIWTDVVPGGPAFGLDDILKKVGLVGR
ncbi:9afd7a0d-7f1b-47ac-9709-d2298b6eba43 [Sclerotinia trifoliorum]|uniref:9afd7a0d-7f1b-47ac-9709-d2298b6eba43 n=1 Tax=Sclerotinia trifoliorum TaxID=28548 RepID=A0A8H2VRP1_9HELO|nr:9afd7a0d-7f1b-47ac-9709-d2298b6eba43 [Sclerotinia trifoliorum]